MFFRIFNNLRCKPFTAFIIYTLITCYLLTTSGCETTTTTRYPAEYLKTQKRLSDITHIILKDGTYMNLEDKEVFYMAKYRDTSNVLVFLTNDTVRADENGKKVVKIKKTETFLPLDRIQEIYITKTEIDAGNTILLSVGIVLGVFVLILIIAAISWSGGHNSCPYIYSYDGTKYVYDAEPLGGVICEGLMRTDYSRLEHLAPDTQGKFKLLIRNENDEQQFLDEIKLISVNHKEGNFVTPNPEGEFFEYKTIVPPVSVTDESGKDITKFLMEKDDIKWQTDLTTSFQSAALSTLNSGKHTLKFQFKKPEGAKSALIFFNGGTALWGSEMVKSMLELRGDKVDDWYKSVNEGGEEFLKLYSFMEREELFFLKVNLKEDGKYTVRTYIPGGGPKVDEDKIIRLPLENVSGEYIEFTLNPPAGYWKIDQIGMIFDYEIAGKENIQTISASFGKDHDGNDITTSLSKIDKNYYQMPLVGNKSDLYFDVPAGFERTRNEIFLKTTGWYEVNIDKMKPEQKDLISEIMSTPGKIIYYSMSLYNLKLKELTELQKMRNE